MLLRVRGRGVGAAAMLVMALVLSGCGGAPSAPIPDEVRTATEQLFEAHTRAWSESTEAGWEFEVSHNYPGYADASAASAQALRTRMIEAGYWESLVPDLATITPDPSWVPSADGLDCIGTFSSPPDGDTYLVTLDRAGGERSSNALSPQQRGQVHITLLDGTLYYFIPLCT